MNKLVKFFQESYAELKKVTWPTKEEAGSYTQVVIIAVALVAVFLGVVDIGLSEAVNFLLRIKF